jgi:hypothetical protein
LRSQNGARAAAIIMGLAALALSYTLSVLRRTSEEVDARAKERRERMEREDESDRRG